MHSFWPTPAAARKRRSMSTTESRRSPPPPGAAGSATPLPTAPIGDGRAAPRSLRLYPFVAALYTALLIVANVVAVKLAVTPFGPISAAIVCFPLTYAISDVLTEVYG